MVVAVFTNNDDYARALGLTQWDYGQELRIQGLNLPTAVEIHFSLRETGGEAVTRVGVTKDGITTVPIPDSMLEGEGATYEYHIYAWIYLSDTKSGETIKRIDMPVRARSKPEPFDAPEAEELFAEAIEAVNEAADRAEKAGAEAVKVGEEAKEAAVKAGEHLEAVQSLAGQVEINADAVAQDKQAVAGMVTQTQQAASGAALSAQAAKQSQIAAEQAQAGAEAAEDTARQYAAETEEDRQEVAEDKQAVSQMRDDVSADRQAVEGAVAGFDGAVQGAMGEISAAGKTQVSAVNTAGQTAVQAVNTAKGEAVQAVEAEGAEQAGIVAAEGTKQLGEIEQVMATIPEDYTVLSELADSNYRNKAPGIVETATGALIEIRDASDLPVRGLVVYGKSEQVTTKGLNLLPFEVGYEGGNFSVFDDGIQLKTEGYSDIYAVGTNGDINSEEIYAEYSLLPEGDYHILCDSSKVSLFVVVWRNGTSNILTEAKNNISKKITVEKGDKFRIFLRATEKLNERVRAIISKEALTVADYEPYSGGKPSPSIEFLKEINIAGQGGEIEIECTGENILPPNSINKYEPRYFYFYTEKYVNEIIPGYITPGQVLTVIYPKELTRIVRNVSIRNGDSTNINSTNGIFDSRGSAVIRINEVLLPTEKNLIFVGIDKSVELTDDQVNSILNANVMILSGDWSAKELPPYTPYKSSSQIIPFPNGLPGIPVTSGGNYTDKDGQQWVCDTIEWNRVSEQEEYVQMIDRIKPSDLKFSRIMAEEGKNYIKIIYEVRDFDTDGTYIERHMPVMCNKFIWGINAIGTCSYKTVRDGGWLGKSNLIFCVDKSMTREEFEAEILPTLDILASMKEPIRTPLTQDQLNALKQLHTFHTTTIITNDAGVDMQIDYVADTKSYIQRLEEQWNAKLVNIQSALISQKISGGGIKVTDSAHLPVKALRVFGKSTQLTTTGAQLNDGNLGMLIGSIGGTITSSINMASVIIPIQGGESYTISYQKGIKAITFHCTTAEYPEEGMEIVDTYTGSWGIAVSEKIMKTSAQAKYLIINVNAGMSEILRNAMINKGESALPWEPYTGGKPSPSIEYQQEIEIAGGNENLTVRVGTSEEDANPQTVILHTPNGLPGIPISSDGNYTDTSGQQWICDSIEYDSVTDQKEYVQRVGLFRTADGFDGIKIGITDSESGNMRIIIPLPDADPEYKRKPVLCTHGRFYSNGASAGTTFTYNGGIWYTTNSATMTIEEAKSFLTENQMEWLYILKEPIRTPLTQEQVAALKDLHTCSPTTVITTDENVDLELEYTVDTRSYVDEKIAAISAAVIGGK